MSQTSETADRCERPPSPTLCSKNCGFFSNPECNGMCSICYRNFLSKEKKTATVDETTESNSLRADAVRPLDSSREADAQQKVEESSVVPSKRPRPSCCPMCNKRVGLLGFDCRCGGRFCEKHRYPEAHQCTFDHKAAARTKLQEENPVVLSEKVDRV